MERVERMGKMDRMGGNYDVSNDGHQGNCRNHVDIDNINWYAVIP